MVHKNVRFAHISDYFLRPLPAPRPLLVCPKRNQRLLGTRNRVSRAQSRGAISFRFISFRTLVPPPFRYLPSFLHLPNSLQQNTRGGYLCVLCASALFCSPRDTENGSPNTLRPPTPSPLFSEISHSKGLTPRGSAKFVILKELPNRPPNLARVPSACLPLLH